MPVEQRRVTVDRSLAASEQENTPLKGIPRSGIRYVEPRTNAPSHPGSGPSQPRSVYTQRPRTTASRPARHTDDVQLRLASDVQYAEDDYAVQTERLPVLDRRIGHPTRPRTAQTARTTQAVPTTTASRQMSQEPVTRPSRRIRRARRHPVFYGGVGLLSILILYIVGLNAWSFFLENVADQLAHGSPRTTQMDVVVGHNHDSVLAPTHVIVFNLHGQILIEEIPANDPTKAQMYLGPRMEQVDNWNGDASNAVVDVSLQDDNHDGKSDLVLDISGRPQLNFQREHLTYVLLNDGDHFAAPKQKGGK